MARGLSRKTRAAGQVEAIACKPARRIPSTSRSTSDEGLLRIYDPRAFHAGRRGFCRRLLEAAAGAAGVREGGDRPRRVLLPIGVRSAFGDGPVDGRRGHRRGPDRRRDRPGADRRRWWSRPSRWSTLTAYRTPDGVSWWETLDDAARPAPAPPRGPVERPPRLSDVAEALAALDGHRSQPRLGLVRDPHPRLSPREPHRPPAARRRRASLQESRPSDLRNSAIAPGPPGPGGTEIAVATGVRRLRYLALAGGSFAMTVIGLVVPGIPTVPFLLATSYYLARSSPRLNDRLRRTAFFGPILVEWEQHQGLSRTSKAKLIGLTAAIVVVTVALSAASPVVLIVILVIALFSAYGIARLPGLPEDASIAPGPARDPARPPFAVTRGRLPHERRVTSRWLHLDKETCNNYPEVGRTFARVGSVRPTSVARHASPHRRDFFCADWSPGRTLWRSARGHLRSSRDGGDRSRVGLEVSSPVVRSRDRAVRPAPSGRGGRSCSTDVASYYLVLKAVFFFSLVRIQVQFDTMKDHWLFLGTLYTAGVAFLSYVFLFSWQKFEWAAWQHRVAADRRDHARAGVLGRDLPAVHALFLAHGEVRRGRDLLDPAAAGCAGRLVLNRRRCDGGGYRPAGGPGTIGTRGRPMGIVFFCQSCGARFEVDPRMAGKQGRCRNCGQYTTIPRAEEIVSMSAMPALAATAAGAGIRGVKAAPPLHDDERPPSLGAWLKAGISQVGLAPLSGVHRPVRPVLPSALDDGEDSKPYRPRQAHRRQPRPRPDPGQRPGQALAADARRRPEGLPLAERERLLRLDPVPDDPAGRRPR